MQEKVLVSRPVAAKTTLVTPNAPTENLMKALKQAFEQYEKDQLAIAKSNSVPVISSSLTNIGAFMIYRK